MLRLLAQLVLSIIANAVGLIVASLLLDGFDINFSSFVVAVLVFSGATVILSPLILKIALTNASFLVGGIALVTTLVGLIITDVFTDGLTITGLDTWVIATLIVWLASIVANLVLPLFIFKKTLSAAKGGKQKSHKSAESTDN